MTTRVQPAAAPSPALRPVEGALARQARGAELLDDHAELAGRRGQVEHAVAARPAGVQLVEDGGQARVALGIVELTLDVARRQKDALAERAVDRLLAVVVVDGALQQRAELVVAELLTPVPDDGRAERQHAVAAEVVERRHELAVREVAGDAEDDEAARVRVTLAAEGRGRLGETRHAVDAHAAVVAEAIGDLVADALVRRVVRETHFFSCTAWPPNSLRRAASTLPLNVSF